MAFEGCREPSRPVSRFFPSTPDSYAFEDDFDGPAGSAPDSSKWRFDVGGGGWGNDELQTYTDSRENSFLNGEGHLVVRATRQVSGSGSRRRVAYRSARLHTRGRFAQYAGVFQARVRLRPRRGLWPAWWAMGADYPSVGWPRCGEIDMLENYGWPVVESSVHTPGARADGVATAAASFPCDEDWHVWCLSWDRASGVMRFFVDGYEYLTVAPDRLPNWGYDAGVPVFMILNLAVGGRAGTPRDDVDFPVDLLVDYVRVW